MTNIIELLSNIRTFVFVITVFKQIVSLILVSVFLLQTFSKVIIYTDYYINKDNIAKVLCINKDKPQMHCEGKCHLKKQLEEQDKEEQSPVNPVKEKNEIQLFSQNNSDIHLFSPSVTNELISYYSFPLSDKHLLSVFHPPKG
ncbi:MAG: hypothetical protein HY841_11815 [Bacteroidetes bacterium]|nr:hypothetical protein [Bacteroidota bacterium]